ncbi:MAG TPA: phosphotransferase [Streptosporangiaceae bacterium]|nr:phosphotransferase [Streptosporangiaceae bacterium]
MTGSDPPGRLIGAGRAADVYDLGDGRVLRRYRVNASAEPEARLMRYLREAGLGVPEVYDASGADLVLAKLDGVDLLSDLSRRPWRAGRHAVMLARMHDQLHEIAAPPWLKQPLGDGDRVLHLDLHPGNVMLTADGPMIIDWSNGAAGPPGADIAMASLIMATSEVDDLPLPVSLIAERIRHRVIRRFEASVSHDFRPYLTAVAKLRIVDRNVRPAEVIVLQRIIDGNG